MRRGEIWWATLPLPIGTRPVVLLTRDAAIQVRTHVTVTELTRTMRRLPTEVELGPDDGLPKRCVANLDTINTIPKEALTERVAMLRPEKVAALERALKFALALD